MSEPVQVLLLGPAPPPHGGISVHVASARRLLIDAGARCRLLDTGAAGGRSGSWRERPARFAGLWREISRCAREGWWVHLHTNGHNRGSWLLALLCAAAARRSTRRLLTLHSGMAAEFLRGAGTVERTVVRLALGGYHRVLCVNRDLHAALRSLGMPAACLEIAPAYLPGPAPDAVVPTRLEEFLAGHRPLLVTALCFRPEYGFPVLVDALERLRARFRDLGCVVIGGGEGEAAARREVSRRGMDGWVRLTGDVHHALCLTLLSRADVFVRPTLEDGDAVSVREAIALGVPVVATDVGARPPAAVLCPAGDTRALAGAIEQVLAGAPRQHSAATAARVAAEPPAQVARLLDVYRLRLSEAGR